MVWDDDDDIFDEDEEEEAEDEEDEDEEFERIEAAFRLDRKFIRDCRDVGELEEMKTTHQRLLARPVSQVARVRCHDLLELLTLRIAELKAKGA